MANPRQKRKQRSSVAKAGISKASKKNLHKVTIKGPAILADNWDKTYAPLPLPVLSSVASHSELTRSLPAALSQQDRPPEVSPSSSSAQPS